MAHITRRTVVQSTAVLGLAGVTGGLLAAPAAAEEAASEAEDTARPTSLNGWELMEQTNDISTVWTRPVPGTDCSVAVCIGDAETVLVHVIRRFHYEVDELRRGDVVGWRTPSEVNKGLTESNQASGTAVQIRPGSYPAGSRGGFFSSQLMVIRDILAELDGVVRWGGDDSRPDESLFSIDVKPADTRLTAVVEKIRAWKDTPGKGPGTPVDVRASGRRKAAKALESRQQGTAA
ncbi:hypothetical protein [Streptomyces sp. NPDC050548]|uniref:hypothetical protein n=1 Tax=Streptomyces sp. NPDC050548 TaxID=3365629 RepID=UPI00379416D7